MLAEALYLFTNWSRARRNSRCSLLATFGDVRLGYSVALDVCRGREGEAAGTRPPERRELGPCTRSAMERISGDSGLWSGETPRFVGADIPAIHNPRAVCRDWLFVHKAELWISSSKAPKIRHVRTDTWVNRCWPSQPVN